MLDFISRFFADDTLSPHGICLLWRPELIWTHVSADFIVGVAYMSIPLAIAYFVWKREDLEFGWIFWCFVCFILACGTTHFLAIVTLWWPIYGIEGLVKAATALISITTAIALWPLVPKALALPSSGELKRANENLTARIAERDRALAALEAETEERTRAEEMLRQSQKMEAIGQLTGNVAHDFNNLLGIVLGSLENIERRLPDDERLRGSIRTAIIGAERAAAITAQLLAFARKQPLKPRTVEVNRLLDDLTPLLNGAVGPHVALNLSLAPDLHAVDVDPNQLENAVLNLVVNARDAVDAQGLRCVDIATRNLSDHEASGLEDIGPARGYVLIEVSDTGVGMTDEVLGKAFEPFFSTKPVGHGTGLGLAQVFGFAKQSGGHVTIASRLGHGTTVSLFLPTAPRSVEQAADLSMVHA